MSGAALVKSPRARPEAWVRRWGSAMMLVALFAVLLLQLGTTLRSSWLLLRYPFGVDYGEGIVWQQMINMLAGKGYAPLGTFPAIVYHYPPLFHLVAGGLAAMTGLDGLAAGRLVSGLATFATAFASGALVWLAEPSPDRRARGAAAALAGLLFLGANPVIEWCATMRVDMLAGLFGAAGMAAAVQAPRRPALIQLAALLLVAAIYTKQVSIAPLVSAFIGLLTVRPNLAWRLAATSLAMGSMILATLSWVTNGGFLIHVFLYNMNRFRPGLITSLRDPLHYHLLYIVLAGAGLWSAARRLRADWLDRAEAPVRTATAVTVLVFLLVKTIMLAMVMKSGASTNYLIEWFEAVAILAAIALAPVIDSTFAYMEERPARLSALFTTVLLGITAVQAITLSRRAISQVDTVPPARAMWRLVDTIRRTPGPVISDDMTLLIRAGRPVEWEPAITAELGAQGRYDQAGFVRLVRARRFAMFITAGGPGHPVFDSRYNPPVQAAILHDYPATQEVDGFVLRRPGADRPSPRTQPRIEGSRPAA